MESGGKQDAEFKYTVGGVENTYITIDAAADIINKLKQTTPGYWKAEDISAALAKNKK